MIRIEHFIPHHVYSISVFGTVREGDDAQGLMCHTHLAHQLKHSRMWDFRELPLFPNDYHTHQLEGCVSLFSDATAVPSLSLPLSSSLFHSLPVSLSPNFFCLSISLSRSSALLRQCVRQSRAAVCRLSLPSNLSHLPAFWPGCLVCLCSFLFPSVYGKEHSVDLLTFS